MSKKLVPPNWSLEELGNVANVIDPHPSHRAPAKVEVGIPFVGIGDVSTDGSVDFSRARLVSHSILNEHRERYSLDDLLIGLGRVASVGKVVRLPSSKYEYVVSPTLAIIKPTGVEYEFLYFALQSPGFQQQLDSNKQGSGRESVGITRLRVLEIPIPPLVEQEKIVEILEEQLSRLDAALASVRVVREKTERFRRSLLHAAFTGALTDHRGSSGNIHEGWRELELGQIGKWITGCTPSTSNPKFFGGLTPFLTPGDISDKGELSEAKRTLSKEGVLQARTVSPPAVLLVCIGATLGKVAITNEMVVTNQQINSLEVDDKKALPKFVKWLLSSQSLQDMLWQSSSSTTVPIINKRKLEGLRITLPSLVEQETIVHIIEEEMSRLDASLRVVDVIEKKSRALRRSLLHAAFSGELTKEWRESAHV
jgi:type I restriction enzyme S subunit